MQELDKKYYKINDVAEFIGVPQSTLRYWEKEFPQCAPKRSIHNRRYYTPENIEQLRIIHFLLKERGLRIDAAKEQLRVNAANISKRFEVITRLTGVRDTLDKLLKTLRKRDNSLDID